MLLRQRNSYSPEQLHEGPPPTQAALIQHIKRSTYQAGHCWSQRMIPELPSNFTKTLASLEPGSPLPNKNEESLVHFDRMLDMVGHGWAWSGVVWNQLSSPCKIRCLHLELVTHGAFTFAIACRPTLSLYDGQVQALFFALYILRCGQMSPDHTQSCPTMSRT